MNKIFAIIAGSVVASILYWHLEPLAKLLTYSLLGFDSERPLGLAIEFMVFETPKVLMLLAVVVFAIGVIQTYFPPTKTKTLLSGRNQLTGHVLAACLGVVTPFCSCSAVPMFIGLVTAGVPLGVTLSFLISAPLVNEVALGLLFSLFGWKVAALYLSTGLLIAIVAGWILGRLKLEKWVEPWVYGSSAKDEAGEAKLNFPGRLKAGVSLSVEIVRGLWLYIILGIAVGGGIHGYVPEGLMASFMGRDVWWSVPLAVILGVPMYSSAAGMIPIVQSLLGKGAALGTSLAFMMAVIGLSLPEAVILRKVMKPKLLACFFGIVALGIMLVGFLFNLLIG